MPNDELDGEIHSQQPTEPAPVDSDHRNTSRLSSPASVRQDAPVTRARARSQALGISWRNEDDDSIKLGHKMEKPKPKTGTGGLHKSPSLTDQALPVGRTGNNAQLQRIDGFGSPMKHDSPTMDRDSVDTVPQTECPKSNSGEDDEYELPETENDNDDSEESIIREIRGGTKKKANKIAPNHIYSSKPMAKKAQAKATPTIAKTVGGRTTKKTSVSKKNRPVVSNQVPNPPVVHGVSPDKRRPTRQRAKAFIAITPEEASQYVPFSFSIMKDSREITSPAKAKSKTPNIRRPKRPFYEAEVNVQQTKPDSNTHRQPTPHRGEVVSLSSSEPKPRVEPAVQNPMQDETFTFDTPQPEAEQQIDREGIEQTADKKKGCTTTNSGLNVTASRVYNSPSISPPSMHSPLTDIDHETVRSQIVPSHHTETQNSQESTNSKPGKRLLKTSQASIIEDPFSDVNVWNRAYSPPFSSKPGHIRREMNTRNGETQTEALNIQSSNRNLYRQVEPDKGGSSRGAAAHLLLGSPQVHNSMGWPLKGELSVATPRKGLEREEKPKSFPFSKKDPGRLNREESLHPNSQAWAEQMAEESRKKKLSAIPQVTTEGREPPNQTPESPQGHRESPISRREITLRRRRDAIFESVREITAVSQVRAVAFISEC